ncbi:hypothetical protein BDP27DRAFT_1424846 [Rhodocollybia butyracea]|nr:hypothetical protein BDP27DRAFT_1424846 [Rhodocollybia butyracea]
MQWIKIQEDLQSTLEKNSNLKLDLSKLGEVVPVWRDTTYPDHIPDNVVRKILDEIQSMSLRWEIMLADKYLYNLLPPGHE